MDSCDPKTILPLTPPVSMWATLLNGPSALIALWAPTTSSTLPRTAWWKLSRTGTSEETKEKVLQIANLHGKTPIVVKDSPGFSVNRIFIPWYVEAIRIIEEGWPMFPPSTRRPSVPRHRARSLRSLEHVRRNRDRPHGARLSEKNLAISCAARTAAPPGGRLKAGLQPGR